MISLQVIMGQKFADAVPQRIFTEEDHLLQTTFLDAPHKTFRVRVQIWGSRWQFHTLDTCASPKSVGSTVESRTQPGKYVGSALVFVLNLGLFDFSF
jgi:hypothetical protein